MHISCYKMVHCRIFDALWVLWDKYIDEKSAMIQVMAWHQTGINMKTEWLAPIKSAAPVFAFPSLQPTSPRDGNDESYTTSGSNAHQNSCQFDGAESETDTETDAVWTLLLISLESGYCSDTETYTDTETDIVWT